MIDAAMDTQPKSTRIRRAPLLLTAGAVLAGIALISCFAFRDRPILRTGMIEAREHDVASKIPGRVASLAVREGEAVTEGQLLFRLSDREVSARVAQAQGAVDAARAQLDMALNGARPEQLDMLQRKVEADRSAYDLAARTLSRMQSLHRDSLISDQELDVVLQKHQAALAALSAAEAELSMARAGPRDEERRMARGQYDRARQALEEARSYLDESAGVAPLTGTVTRLFVDEGELVASGYPILSVLDTHDTWAVLNLPETELHLLRVGDTIPGIVRGLNQTADFRVEDLAAMADFANWRAQDDRGTFEVRSFTVTLRPTDPVPGLRPGMTVQFDLSGR